jgi:hypothetical protein
MKRFWHYLKANQGSESIQNCIFVDTETDDVNLDKGRTGKRLRFGWAAHVRRTRPGEWTKPDWRKFTDASDFWLWAMCHTRAKNKLWVWCHNSNFDYPALDAFRLLPDLGWEMKRGIVDAPPTIVKYVSHKKTLMLVDTLNIWRMSEKKLGQKVGLEKLEHDFKWGDTEKDDTYCKRDVEILIKAVTHWADWLRDNDMGGFAPTIAGQAMRTFRHKYMDDKILIENNDLTLALARKCYHGGRCEAGYIGRIQEPVYSVDVNSMYPYVMSYAEMPVRLKGYSHNMNVKHLERLLKDYCVCALVRIETQEPFAAIYRNGKLCFPVGEFYAYLSTPELKYAIESNCLREVYKCACYEKAVPFRRFALDLYQQKEAASRNGNLIEAEHWKLLLNSFYGKWGQSGGKWVRTGVCDPSEFRRERSIDAQSLKITMRRYFGGLIFERSQDTEGMESHPAIAAHVTAEARMVLWAIIKQLPPSQYMYADTDGLLIRKEGFDSLRERMDNYVLGKIKHVKTYSDVTIYGCKDLILDGKATLKGIRNEAECIEPGHYRQLKWVGIAGLLSAGIPDMPFTVFVDKFLRRTYDKGLVGADGFVTPIHLAVPGMPA